MNACILKFAGYEIKGNVHKAKLKIVILQILTLLIAALSIVMSLTITTEVVIFYLATMFYKVTYQFLSEKRQREEMKEIIDKINQSRSTIEKAHVSYSSHFTSLFIALLVLVAIYIVNFCVILDNGALASAEAFKGLYLATVIIGIIIDMTSNIIGNVVNILGGKKMISVSLKSA